MSKNKTNDPSAKELSEKAGMEESPFCSGEWDGTNLNVRVITLNMNGMVVDDDIDPYIKQWKRLISNKSDFKKKEVRRNCWDIICINLQEDKIASCKKKYCFKKLIDAILSYSEESILKKYKYIGYELKKASPNFLIRTHIYIHRDICYTKKCNENMKDLDVKKKQVCLGSPFNTSLGRSISKKSFGKLLSSCTFKNNPDVDDLKKKILEAKDNEVTEIISESNVFADDTSTIITSLLPCTKGTLGIKLTIGSNDSGIDLLFMNSHMPINVRKVDWNEDYLGFSERKLAFKKSLEKVLIPLLNNEIIEEYKITVKNTIIPLLLSNTMSMEEIKKEWNDNWSEYSDLLDIDIFLFLNSEDKLLHARILKKKLKWKIYDKQLNDYRTSSKKYAVIWGGDFNSRIYSDSAFDKTKYTKDIISGNVMKGIGYVDQLTKIRDGYFKEALILFPPTCKLNIDYNNASLDDCKGIKLNAHSLNSDIDDCYVVDLNEDSKKGDKIKLRVPSFCDRIIYDNSENVTLTVKKYDAFFDPILKNVTDHMAVVADIIINFK